MGKKFDELMNFSDKGYVCRYDDIEEAVDKMLNTRLEEIQFPPSYNWARSVRRLFHFTGALTFGFDINDDWPLSSEYLGKIKLGELIVLAEHYYNFDEKPEYGNLNLSAEVYELLCCAAKTNFNVYFFLSVSALGFLSFAGMKAGGKKSWEMGVFANVISKFIKGDKSVTLQNLFSKLESIMCYNTVRIGLNQFNEDVRNSRTILKMVLTDSIKLIHPEIFDFERLKKRICKELGFTYQRNTILPCRNPKKWNLTDVRFGLYVEEGGVSVRGSNVPALDGEADPPQQTLEDNEENFSYDDNGYAHNRLALDGKVINDSKKDTGSKKKNN